MSNESSLLRPVFRVASSRDRNDKYLDSIITRWVAHDIKGEKPFDIHVEEIQWLLMECRQLRLAMCDLEQGLMSEKFDDAEKVRASLEHATKVLEFDPFSVVATEPNELDERFAEEETNPDTASVTEISTLPERITDKDGTVYVPFGELHHDE